MGKRSSNQTLKDESEVLRRLGEGNELAFDYFFHKFYPLVVLFAERIVRDRALAEEVAQDVFFKVWERRDQFATVASLRSFLYVAARNACFNGLSKIQNRSKYQEAYAALTDQTEAPVLREIIRSEVWAELSGAIDTLPPQCRQIIRLIFEEDKKPREIAEELGVTVSTVNNQKARGIRLLKKLLGRSHYDALVLAIAILSK